MSFVGISANVSYMYFAQWYFAIECVVSIAPRAEVHCKLTADLLFKNPYNFVKTGQGHLIFYQ